MDGNRAGTRDQIFRAEVTSQQISVSTERSRLRSIAKTVLKNKKLDY